MDESIIKKTYRFLSNLIKCLYGLLVGVFFIGLWVMFICWFLWLLYSFFFNYEKELASALEKPAKRKDVFGIAFGIPLGLFMWWGVYEKYNFTYCFTKIKEFSSYIFGGKLALPASRGGPPIKGNDD
jgi:uncharacterized protein with PQ loop repeat